MRNWINQLSIRKKLIFYSYLIITPILLCISGIIFMKNYGNTMDQEIESCMKSVDSLADNIEGLQVNIMELGTYICINNDINKILRSKTPQQLNEDSQIWMHRAPMQIIQDIVALNGIIRTIAIYPENGVRPYLRCMDASAYLQTMDEVQMTGIYKQAVENKGQPLWQYAYKSNVDTYETNRSDKIVMYREIYDLSQKEKLGYLIIGASAERFCEICESSLQREDEGIVVISKEQTELLRCGNIDDDILRRIQEVTRLPGGLKADIPV